jgi:hypothetical protein
MVIFAVDDVAAVRTRILTRRLAELTGDVLVMGGDPDLPVLEPDGVHPLLSAVGRAFAEHRPLVLSPDAVWLTIAAGIAQHVRLNAEELRPRLVSHAGRKRLTVSVDGPMPADPGSWADIVEEFTKLLAAEIRDPVDFECDFSTSTNVERTAGRIVLMDAYSPYFSYWLRVICGIPEITLTGTPEDWRKIRDRVGMLAGLGLETWCRSLAPITSQFVRAAEGDVDVAFWRRIYNPADAYGGDVITGWAARLYPYLERGGTASTPNPLLDLPIDQPRDLTSPGHMGYSGPGIRSDDLPATLSKVIVNVHDVASGNIQAVALWAGLAGVTQDDGGALRPVANWHLAQAAADIGEVIDRLVALEQVTLPESGPRPRGPRLEGPSEVIALYHRIGSAMLCGGSWRLRPVAEHGAAWLRRSGHSLKIIADLPDGRSLAAATGSTTRATHWIAARFAEDDSGNSPVRTWPREVTLLDDLADVPVYGTSLARILEAVLDSGDIAHLESGRLCDLAG